MPNLLLLIFALASLACLIGLSLGALGLLLPALMPEKVQTTRQYLRLNSFWMGLGHGPASYRGNRGEVSRTSPCRY